MKDFLNTETHFSRPEKRQLGRMGVQPNLELSFIVVHLKN
jgi:hypothetical protein